MKPESKFWKEVKKNTPNILWTRLESWASFGVPDLLGYHESCAFFMCELKIKHGQKILLSPHQILFHTTRTKRNFILVKDPASRSVKLYPSSAVTESGNVLEDSCLCTNDWRKLELCLLGRL